MFCVSFAISNVQHATVNSCIFSVLVFRMIILQKSYFLVHASFMRRQKEQTSTVNSCSVYSFQKVAKKSTMPLTTLNLHVCMALHICKMSTYNVPLSRGLCSSKGYGFSAVLDINRVSILVGYGLCTLALTWVCF